MKRLALLCLVPLIAHAGNLGELLGYAAQNQKVEASKYTLEAAKEKAYATKSAYLPSLSLGANQTYNHVESMLSPKQSRTGSATLSLTLYDGGKREALFDQQNALVQAATFSMSSTQNDVSLDVVYYYYNYLSTLQSKEAAKQKMEQLVAERYRLEKYLSVGAATNDELQKIIASIEQTNVDLLSLDNTLNNILNTLAYLTDKEVRVEEGSHVILQAESAAERFDILALEASTQSAKAEAQAAKSGYLPSIVLQDTYSRYKYDYDNPAWQSDNDHQNSVQLSASWKIFDFGSSSAAYEAAQKSYLAKSSELAYEKSRAKAGLKSAQNSYKTAVATVEAAKARLEAASMTYDLVKKKFQQGIVNNVTYLDALSSKFDAQSGLYTALNQVEYQKAVLLYQMGQEIKGAIQ
jgi:outer membrane protein TolC